MSTPSEAFASSKFVPESPSHWISDEARKSCHKCSTNFSIFNRKHHCRSCRDVFCASCTNFRLLARAKRERNLIVRVRVCQDCFAKFKARKRGQSSRELIKQSNKPSINQTTAKSVNVNENGAKELIEKSEKLSSQTVSLDAPSINATAPLPVGKLSVVSHASRTEEEDDFYSDDEDHPMETDDESDPALERSETIKLDGDRIPSIFTITEESSSVEPKIVSEEREDQVTKQTVSLDRGKIDNTVFKQYPMTLTGRTNEAVYQSLDDRFNDRVLDDILHNKEANSQSVEKTDVNLDGAHLASVVTTIKPATQSSLDSSKQEKVFSMSFDSTNLEKSHIVIDPSRTQPTTQSSAPSVIQSSVKSASVKKATTPSNNQLTELDRPFDDDHNQSIVSGPGSINKSINAPDLIADSIAHPSEDQLHNQSVDRSVDRPLHVDARSSNLSADRSTDQSVLSTRSASPIGLAALPDQPTKQANKHLVDQPLLSEEITGAQKWAEKSQSRNSTVNQLNSGLPVPPAYWPNQHLVNEIEESTEQPIAHSTDRAEDFDASISQSVTDMWSPIGPTSSSPLGLAAMKSTLSDLSASQSSNLSSNQPVKMSSSSEFERTTGKRKVKVRVLKTQQPSWRSRIFHPVPSTLIVCLSVVIAAMLLPATVIGLTGIAGIAALIAYFWPNLYGQVTHQVHQVSQQVSHDGVSHGALSSSSSSEWTAASSSQTIKRDVPSAPSLNPSLAESIDRSMVHQSSNQFRNQIVERSAERRVQPVV